MINNQIEQILADAGICANALLQENGLWLITEIIFVADHAMTIIDAPFEIPSMHAEKWLACVFAGDTEGAHALEVTVIL